MALDKLSFLYNFTRVLSLVVKVVLLRKDYDFSVTSWWRTEKRNNEVGGLPKSLHIKGLAIDVVLDSTVDKASFDRDANEIGLYVYDEGDHLHLYERVET